MQLWLEDAVRGKRQGCIARTGRSARCAVACYVGGLLALTVGLLSSFISHGRLQSVPHVHDPWLEEVLHPGPVFSMDVLEVEEDRTPKGTTAPLRSQDAYERYVEEVLQYWVQERQESAAMQHALMQSATKQRSTMGDNNLGAASSEAASKHRYAPPPEQPLNNAMLLHTTSTSMAGCVGEHAGSTYCSTASRTAPVPPIKTNTPMEVFWYGYQPSNVKAGAGSVPAGKQAHPVDGVSVWQVKAHKLGAHMAVYSMVEVDDAIAWLYHNAIQRQQSLWEPIVVNKKEELALYLAGTPHLPYGLDSWGCKQHSSSSLGPDLRGTVRRSSGRHLTQISGTALNAVSGVVQRNIAFNCSTLSGLQACAEPLCFDVFSLVRLANGSVVCRQTGSQTGGTSATIIVAPYAYDYFFNFNQNLVLFGFSAGLDLQSVIRARAREPSGDDWYNYIIRTRNARASAGSFRAVDYSNVYSRDTPFTSLGINTVQPFTYNIRYSPFTAINTIQTRQVVPGYTNNGLAVLTSAQYTVFGNTGLPWLP